MGTTAGLVTVAEFERMRDPAGFRLELHHGEVVKLPPPKPNHVSVQDRIAEALRAIASAEWRALVELPFRPQAEHEVWVADVGVINAVRWRDAGRANVYPLGAPELVIEVLSPSNTVSEMYDRERTCFNGGCREFWIVDPDTRRIYVTFPDAPKRTYGSGEQVPVALLGDATIAVDQIFQDQ
jgi:Uma2 family endonuclease